MSLYNKSKSRASGLLLAVLMLSLVGCSTPEEKAKAYVEKGNELLQEGSLEKAKIEFKNALQLKKTSVDAVYGLALIAEKEANWQQAYALLSEVVLKAPKNLQAQVKYGSLLLAANELDRATEVSKKLTELNKDDPDVLTFQAALALRKGDPTTAVTYANQALAKKPNAIDAYIILASERLVAKDYDKTLAFLDQGLTKDPKHIPLQLMKLKVYEMTAQLDKVEAIYKNIIKDTPDSVGFRKALAEFYFKQGRKDEAEAEFRKLVELQPKDLNLKLDLTRYLSQIKGIDAGRKQLEAFVKAEPDNYDLKFALFSMYETIKDSKASEQLLLQIIDEQRNEPNGLKAKGFLATRYLSAGKKDEAIKMIDEIIEKDARNEQALTLKAGLEIDSHDYDNAVAHLRTVLRDNPNSTRTLVLLAKVHDITGDNALAEEHYLKAFEASKHAPEYGLEYANYLVKRKQDDRALKVLNDVVKQTPNYLQALKLMAKIKLTSGDYAGAQEVADRIKTNNAPEGERLEGVILEGQKNYTESIASFKRAYESTPNNSQSIADLARAYIVAGKIEDAKTFLKEKIVSNPDNPDVVVMLSQLYSRGGEVNKAVDLYKSFIASHPQSPVGYRELAVMYLQSKQIDQAQTVISQGLTKLPNESGLKLVQAGIYEAMLKYDDAIKAYEELFKTRPDNTLVANNLASILSDHKTDKASFDRAFLVAQGLNKSNVAYFVDTYGWAAYKAGKFPEAVTALRDAVSKSPDAAILSYHLGMAELANGQKSKAKESLEKALQLSKNNDIPVEEVKKTLATL